MTENNAGKIQMVVFDWGGTTVDYGSMAPATVFERVFSEAGIHLTRDEINRPMGMEKKSHIRELLKSESGNRQWLALHHTAWTEDDVNGLYENFENKLADVVAEYSSPIPGTVEAAAELRKAGILIGSTTGYTSQIMEKVIPAAKAGGYEADCVVTPDLVGSGRPAPFMIFECMRRMNVYPPASVVKAGDTIVDIREGKNAGVWSIGILTASNLLGLTKPEYDAMSPEKIKKLKEEKTNQYFAAGADLVIDSISELPAALETLNRRIASQKV